MLNTSPYFKASNNLKSENKQETKSKRKLGLKLTEMSSSSTTNSNIKIESPGIVNSIPQNMIKIEKFEMKEIDYSENEPNQKKNKWEPPMWHEQLDRIRQMRSESSAPVDTMGCDSLANLNPNLSARDKRFCVLISLMLSSQTRDEVTAKAVGELEKFPLNVETILKLEEEKISQVIYPVSFYKVTKILNYL